MIFGGTDKERIQFNEQTLWTGDEIKMGNYQPFGDLFIDSPELSGRHRLPPRARSIRSRPPHHLHRQRREIHPRGVFQPPGQGDGHPPHRRQARRDLRHHPPHGHAQGEDLRRGDTITATGSLENGLAYESRVQVLAEKGKLNVSGQNLTLDGADSATILLAAATDFANSPERRTGAARNPARSSTASSPPPRKSRSSNSRPPTSPTTSHSSAA